MSFFEEGIARVGGRDADSDIGGKWTWSGSSIVVSASMTQPDQSTGRAKDKETYKYFLEWDKSSNDLILEKMVILRPFSGKDGTKRQNWMSSLKFKENLAYLPSNLSNLAFSKVCVYLVFFIMKGF